VGDDAGGGGGAGARLVLFQCPASFQPSADNVERMRRFFGAIERGALRLLWEPRGDWPEPLIRTLCGELDLAHVVDPCVAETVTPRQPYFRMHGIGGWRHVFSDGELSELGRRLPRAEIAYVMFNNVAMVSDARRFQELLINRAGRT